MTRLVTHVLLACSCAVAYSQDPDPINLQLASASAEESNLLRLLPASPDLKEGNAAVVLLRIIWEKTGWMQNTWPELDELARLPHTDQRVVDFPFDSFARDFRRAAMMRTAVWEYPLNDEPLGMILLPDVQGLRYLAGRGMKIWIGKQIAMDDLNAAHEGIQTQLACARHLARTPILINHLTATSVSRMGLQRCELVVQQPKSPNLYWALAALPESLGPIQEAIQWQSRMLEKSLPSLMDGPPSIGGAGWKVAAAECSEFMELNMFDELTPIEAKALKERMVEAAREELETQFIFSRQQIADMSDEEMVMRWILLSTKQVNTKIENAFSLPAPAALKMLGQAETEIEGLQKRLAAPVSPFLAKPVDTYLALYAFDRHVKLLQIVEAIRDHMAGHDGLLPASLTQVQLHVPADPFTGKSFKYVIEDGTAVLSMPLLETIPVERQCRVTYRISN